MKRSTTCADLLRASALLLAFFAAAPAPADEEAPHPTDLNNKAVEIGKAGRYEEAIGLLKQAQALAPNDDSIRKNLSMGLTDWGIHLQKSGDSATAERKLLEAVAVDSSNGLAYAYLGNLYYLDKNDFDRAILAWNECRGKMSAAEWKDIADRITQAERDRGVERRFLTKQTPHFQVRYPTAALAETADRLGDRLEKEFARIAGRMSFSPPMVSVILYGTGELERTRSGPDWAIGFYDGRIRVRAEDVQSGLDQLVVPHELAHAFLQKEYGSQLPIWVQEGFAQLWEPEMALTPEGEALRRGLSSRSSWVPLEWLDTRFSRPSDLRDVDRAYLQSKMVVEFLTGSYGMEAFKDFCKRLSSAEPVEQAFEGSFSVPWTKVNQGNLEK